MKFHKKPARLVLACAFFGFSEIMAPATPQIQAADAPALAQPNTTAGTVAPSAAEAHPLPVGSQIPDVRLQTMDNQTLSLREAVARQPTVLIFYRGGWCPFCNAHLGQLETIVNDLKGLNYQILALTPDLPSNVAATAEKDYLTYTILSDPHEGALKGFGVAFRVDDTVFNKYRNDDKIDLEKWSGNSAHLLPVPSVFVLDTKGVIRYVHSDPDYKVRLAPDKVLAAAREAKSDDHP